MYLQTEEELRGLYGFPKGRAKDKQLASLEKHSINFIKHSPFVTISTFSKSGLADCSPRGGSPGFVEVINNNCIIIPDAKGNKRLDSLVNIVQTGKLACLFLIPGVDETLRVNGIARISQDPEYLQRFQGENSMPQTCIELTINEVFLHCAKALMRSKLWSPDALIDRSSFPTMGRMINDQLFVSEEPESHEDMVKRYETDL